MAKKKRTPPAPTVQAPKRRYEATTVGFSRRTKLLLAAGAAAAIAVVAIAVAAFGGGGGKNRELGTSLTASGCRLKTYPNLGQQHVQSLTASPKYNSFPPTSGPHYFQPAPWNFYDSPIDSQVRVVHNLEHGGIVVQWGREVPRSAVAQLHEFWQESPNALLMAPLPALGNRIAMTAWTHLATCTRLTVTAFRAFRDAYRAKGPERFPLDQLAPGT